MHCDMTFPLSLDGHVTITSVGKPLTGNACYWVRSWPTKAAR